MPEIKKINDFYIPDFQVSRKVKFDICYYFECGIDDEACNKCIVHSEERFKQFLELVKEGIEK